MRPNRSLLSPVCSLWQLIGLSLLSLLALPVCSFADDVQVDFHKQIEPLLRRHCYRCHGQNKQAGGLNLTSRSSAFGQGDSEEAFIIAGKPQESYLLHRLTDDSFGDVMPVDAPPLKKEETQLLTRWIEQGAHWPDEAGEILHWAYQKLERPTVPALKSVTGKSLQPVDAFIQQQLTGSSLTPAERLPDVLWLRRVSLAILGLPPTLEQLERFQADQRADAREYMVDELLASPRFGEKWAINWLDLARYADSNGFQADQLRESWPYRDWVINSINQDQPFDQFVIEQLAGDLLPDASQEQKIATGFHRTVTCNVEAGVHPEQNRVNQVFDRVNTTGTAFLGTTLECAQCHDHKYDPFDQEDYYRLFACFNNTPLEVKNTAGVTWDFYGPAMELPLPQEKQELRKKLDAELAAAKQQLQEIEAAHEPNYLAWVQQLQSETRAAAWEVLHPAHVNSSGGEELAILPDGSVLVTGRLPGVTEYKLTAALPAGPLGAIKLEALTHEQLPGNGPGRGDAERTNFVLNEFVAQLKRGDNTIPLPLTTAAADFSQNNWDVQGAIDGKEKTGWAIGPQFSQDHWASFGLAAPLSIEPGDQIEIRLIQKFGHNRSLGRFRISIDAQAPIKTSVPENLLAIAQRKNRNAKQEKQLKDHFQSTQPDFVVAKREVARLQKQLETVKPTSTLVMVEMEEPRETFIFDRGEYLHPKQQVQPGLPKVFGNPEGLNPPNRLGLARWIVSAENPLLARITVNRWWRELFGQGLVTTPEDFGSQGDLPTHPELLDWLACELMNSGWSRKSLIRTIVLSETFAQSSAQTDIQRQLDPENKLYSRGPRFRMTAEVIRDCGLAMSGLLSEKMGGTPVMPYQPDGLWRSIGRNQPKWQMATSEDRFRRGIYIIWKRDAPYPSLMNFDAPDRTACVAQRPRTNTPLQALTLLNDPAFGEMAVGLAARMLAAEEQTTAARIKRGFQIALSREPNSTELAVLTELLESEQKFLEANPAAVEARLKLLQPGHPLNVKDQQLLALWFAAAQVLLNLDETMTQG